MKLKEGVRTETYDPGIVEGFLVDVVETANSFDAWLYHSRCGIKELLFGVPKEQTYSGKRTSKDEFLIMVRNNLLLNNYMGNYLEEYMK